MTCQKCNGLLISERILEFYPHTDRWKCINCGAPKEKRFTAPNRNRAAADSHSER